MIWGIAKLIGWRGWLGLAACAIITLGAIRIDRNGFDRGVARELAKQQAAAARQQERFDRAESKAKELASRIAAYEEANRILGMEIENEFRSDPSTRGCVPSDADRLRLKRWWAGSGSTSP